MRLPNILKKIKELPDMPKDIFILVVIFLIGVGAFLLGRYSAYEERRGGELRITSPATTALATPSTRTNTIAVENGVGQTSPQGMYVGSRGGTTYHLPWCGGAKRIKEENKIWFQSKDEASARGYKPATNCNGI